MRTTILVFCLAWTGVVHLSASPVYTEDNPETKRYVIIHADDAGMSHSVNVATIEGMEKEVYASFFPYKSFKCSLNFKW